ncbi:MAG: hemerythrin domain-containing protein [Bryobacteraceae bacterium]|nr:hemerythrin domain-containing protein [Bryobacteraceae bacterium]
MLRDKSLIPLSHQHHNGLALCVLVNRSLQEDESPQNVARQARRIIDRYEVELVNHFEVEERILFPACPSELTEDLIREHREIESLVESLRAAPSPERLREFTDLLHRHIRREEEALFEEIQKALPRERLEDLGRKIDASVVRICL